MGISPGASSGSAEISKGAFVGGTASFSFSDVGVVWTSVLSSLALITA